MNKVEELNETVSILKDVQRWITNLSTQLNNIIKILDELIENKQKELENEHRTK
jgi:predicted nucleic acid-binding Zn ribbon protein